MIQQTMTYEVEGYTSVLVADLDLSLSSLRRAVSFKKSKRLFWNDRFFVNMQCAEIKCLSPAKFKHRHSLFICFKHRTMLKSDLPVCNGQHMPQHLTCNLLQPQSFSDLPEVLRASRTLCRTPLNALALDWTIVKWVFSGPSDLCVFTAQN